MIADDSLDDFGARLVLLLGAKQLDADPLPIGVEVLIKEELLHLLVDEGKAFIEDGLHQLLVFPCLEVVLHIGEHFGEGKLEIVVDFLCLHGDDFDEPASDGWIFILVVSTDQGHFFDYFEELIEELMQVEHLLEVELRVGVSLNRDIKFPGRYSFLQEKVVWTNHIVIQPVVGAIEGL